MEWEFVGKTYSYEKESTDLSILCNTEEPPGLHEKLLVSSEVEIAGFPYYKVSFIEREGNTFFELARPLLRYYISIEIFVEVDSETEIEDKHQGMLYNEYTGRWIWL